MKIFSIKLLFISLLIIKIGFSQEDKQSFVEYEKTHFLKTLNIDNTAYPGDSTYDVVYYKLDLNVSYSPKFLSGAVTVSAKSLEDNLTSLFLDLTDVLSVDSVISNNKHLLFNHSENKLIIYLDKSYSFDERFTLIVYYQGIPVVTGLGSFVFDSHNGEPSIWTLSEPYGARDWWPCKDTPADKADSSDVLITCPSNLIGVSNGTLTNVVDNNNGTKTYIWKSRYPIANYLISLAISNYSVYTIYYHYTETDSMPVVNYIYPEDLNEIKPELDKTTKMLGLFNKLYGQYPFIKEKYGHAEFGSGGMEHQTITSIGIFNDDVIAHELTHQWFGDKVTCRNWENIWLHEGFATYGQGLYYEFSGDTLAFNSFLSYQFNRAKNAVGSIFVNDISSINSIFDGNRSYSKGAMVLHMLRGIVGDSVFFNILKNYSKDPSLAYSTATTEDFERVAEETSGLSLNYFFNQWIYGENYPKYILTWNFGKTSQNQYDVSLVLEQAVNLYPKFFTMPIQIKLSTSSGDTTITIFNDAQIQDFNFTVTGKPTLLTFDPNNFLLNDVIISDPPSVISKYEFELEQNYPNPFNNSTDISYSLTKESFVTLKVYDSLGREVSSLVNGDRRAGIYKISFDGSSLSSGIYFYRLSSGEFNSVKKMLLLK
jgi:aminopeptidase N